MHALRGVLRLFSMTPNATIHAAMAIAVVVFAILFRVTPVEWCILLLCIGIVLAMEAVNTSIESLCDEVTTDFAPHIKDAKDLSAGAVLLMSIISAIIGLIIFIPYLCRILS